MNIDKERLANIIINDIMRKNKDKGSFNRKLFIVHNFFSLTKIKSVQEKIQKNIFNCFGKDFETADCKQNKEPFCFKQYYENDIDNPIEHLIIAKEGSEAGLKYN